MRKKKHRIFEAQWIHWGREGKREGNASDRFGTAAVGPDPDEKETFESEGKEVDLSRELYQSDDHGRQHIQAR